MDGNLILFKDGRFHMEGISLCIPEGYYLDMVPREQWGDVAFELVAPNKTHRISIHVSYDKFTPGEQLVNMVTEMGAKMLSNPEPLTLAGLHGRIATYQTSRHVYAEAIFRLEDSEEFNAFHLVFIFPSGRDISDFINSDDFLQLAQHIHKEESAQ